MQITLKTTLKNPKIKMTVVETNGNPGPGFGHAPKCRWLKVMDVEESKAVH
jgi:hypothetical protein